MQTQSSMSQIDDEVIVSEGEELEQANESAFGQLMASAAKESRCVTSQVSHHQC